MSESTDNRRHPESTFQAQYPYNQATITRSGHEIHLNDTPGNESIRIAHTKGTYIEVESTGRWVQVIAEKAYQYIKSAMALTVDSHMDVKVGGTYTFNCDQSAFEAVATDKTVGVGGNLIDGVSGTREVHTEGDKLETVNGDSVSGIKGDLHQAIQGAAVTNISGIKSDILQSDWSVTSGASVEMTVDGKFRVKCNEFIVDAASITMTTAGGDITITSGGKITVNGAAEINVNGSSSIDITATGVTYINGAQIRLND